MTKLSPCRDATALFLRLVLQQFVVSPIDLADPYVQPTHRKTRCMSIAARLSAPPPTSASHPSRTRILKVATDSPGSHGNRRALIAAAFRARPNTLMCLFVAAEELLLDRLAVASSGVMTHARLPLSAPPGCPVRARGVL